jgi:hypothetical protein
VQVTFTFTVGGRTFRPAVEFSGLRPEEAARVTNPAAQRIARALAIVEAASYWKATVSPVIEIGIGATDPAEIAWWEKFWIPAMGEFLYRNGIDFTTPGFVRIATAPGLPAGEPTAPGRKVSAARPLVMFSGGKDSLALTYVLKDGPVDFFLYNPTQSQRTLARSLGDGGRITEVHRSVLPELLAMNDSGEFLNGAHALLRLPGAGRDVDRVPEGQRCDRRRQLAKRRRAERLGVPRAATEPPVDQER